MASRHVAVRTSLVKRILTLLALLSLPTLLPLLTAACGAPTLEVGTPFTVAHTGPSHGATGIAVDTDVRIGFSDAIDRDSARANVSLAIDDEEVARSTLFFDNDTLLVLVPVRTLPSDTLVTLRIGPDIESAAGVDLDSTLTVEFTTAP